MKKSRDCYCCKSLNLIDIDAISCAVVLLVEGEPAPDIID